MLSYIIIVIHQWYQCEYIYDGVVVDALCKTAIILLDNYTNSFRYKQKKTQDKRLLYDGFVL